MIDREIHLARALLVEGNAMLRGLAVSQLRDLGIGNVQSVGRVREARLLIEREPFDIIVCNREFEGSDDNGQELLDELRRENLLPHSTVFLMVTSQATYHQVVEAAEAALDGLLVRPYTAAMFAERLTEARHRKRQLGDILKALDGGQVEVALARALKRFQDNQPYATYCGRLVAELLMRLNRPEDALKVFERLAHLKKAPWARLGIARARIAAGQIPLARKMIADVLAEDPKSADAHELAGSLLVDQGDFAAAFVEYRQAAEITPGCLLRAQQTGSLAFYEGRGAEAKVWLTRTLGMGLQSRLFDGLTLLLLAFLRHDDGDKAGTASMRDQLLRYRERFPNSARVARFCTMADASVLLLSPARNQVAEAVSGLAAQTGADDFDLEAANMLMALLARLPAGVMADDARDAIVGRIGLRFCVSKAMTEVLIASARREGWAESVVRGAQARLSAWMERAMEQSLAGDPGTAAEMLLRHGQDTLNVKLLEMAAMIARRHEAKVADAAHLIERSSAIIRRSCTAANHIAGMQRAGRSPGGLQLRGKQDERLDLAA